MKEKRKKIGSILLVALFLLILPHEVKSAETQQVSELDLQDEQSDLTEEEDDTIAVTDIEIADYETELEVGKTTTISGTILPADATETTITYSSSDPSIATVNSTGEVKGIRKGTVTITLKAGEISKAVSLNVKVGTTGIRLNKDYVVLKLGETFLLLGKVMPTDAPQTITYKSADTSIATVSSDGLITGKKTGTTTIMVSNEDVTVAASVIVNQAVDYKPQETKPEEILESEVVYPQTILASENSVVDVEMLKYLYETKQVLKIVGEGYTIEIDGADIVNYNNQIYTDIALKQEKDTASFVINQGKELCGAITLHLEEPTGNYLYLYNNAKEKYNYIKTDDVGKIRLTTAGEYQLRETKMITSMQSVSYVVIGGMAVLLIGVVIYIIVKRKYWFW